MSYFLDDDASQIREIKDRLEKLQSDFLSSQFSVSQENVESGQSIFSGANPSARGGGTSGGSSGITLPINVTITDNGDTWTGTQTLDLGIGNGHVFKWTVDQDLTFASAVSNIPASGTQRTFELEFVHDGIGGTFTVTLPSNFADENGNTLASFDISSGTALLSCRINNGQDFLVQTKNIVAATALVETFTWTADHSANNFDLLAVNDIDFDGLSSTISGLHNLQFAQTSQSINSLAGQVAYQGAALDKHSFVLGGAEVAKFDEAAAGVYSLDMLAHKIKNSREHSFDNATEAIITNTEAVIGYSPTTEAAMMYNVPTGKSHIKKVNDVDIMTLSENNLTFADGHQTIFNPDATNPGVNIGLAVGDPSATNNGDLWYNSSTNKFRTKENGVNVDVISSGVSVLDDLTDVTISSVSALEVLRYDGSNWVNTSVNIGDLADVILTAPAINAYLKYNGTNWIDSAIVDGDLPATVMHTDLVQTVTAQKTFDASGTSVVVTNRINMNGNVQIGSSIVDEIFVNGFVSTDIHVEGRQAIRSNDSAEIGYFVTNESGIPGGKGTIEIPHVNGSSSTAAQADTDFGAYEGAIGIYMNDTTNSHVLVVRQPSGNWAGTILTDNTLV